MKKEKETKNETKQNIIVCASTKGGVGKTTIASNIAPALIPNNRGQTLLIEIDTHNDSTKLLKNSNKIKSVSFSAKNDTDSAMNEVLFATINENNCVVDLGGSDDTFTALKQIEKDINGDQLIVLIPLTSDFETVENAIKTAKLCPDNATKVLVFSNFSSLDDFWFIFGNKNFGVEQDFSILSHFDETMEAPQSQLIGIAKLYQTSVYDLSLVQYEYDYKAEQQKYAQLSREEFSQFMSTHRLSVSAGDYIENIIKSRKKVSQWQ